MCTRAHANTLTHTHNAIIEIPDHCQGLINFDDINDGSAITDSCCTKGSSPGEDVTLSKLWIESQHYFVIVDFFRNYYDIMLLKLWVFALSFKTSQDGVASLGNVEFITLCTLADSIYLASLHVVTLGHRLLHIRQLGKNFFFEFDKTILLSFAGLAFQVCSYWKLIKLEFLVFITITLLIYVIRARGLLRTVFECCSTKKPQYYNAQMAGNARPKSEAKSQTNLGQISFWIIAFALTALVEVQFVGPIVGEVLMIVIVNYSRAHITVLSPHLDRSYRRSYSCRVGVVRVDVPEVGDL